MLEAMGRGLAREKEGRDALLPESRQHISGAEHTLHIMEQAPVNLFIINPLAWTLIHRPHRNSAFMKSAMHSQSALPWRT